MALRYPQTLRRLMVLALMMWVAVVFASAWQEGNRLEVQWQGYWWPAEVLEADGGKTLVHYQGWATTWDEWVEASRTRPLVATDVPAGLPVEHRLLAEALLETASADAASADASGPAVAAGGPAGDSRGEQSPPRGDPSRREAPSMAPAGGSPPRGDPSRREAPSMAAATQLLSAILIRRPVTDLADMLSNAEEDRIAEHLQNLRRRTGIHMAILLVHTTAPESIEVFSLRVAKAWGGGDRETSKGLLFTLAMGDRAMRLEVGAGLELRLPSHETGQLIRLAGGHLKDGRTADGLLAVIAEIDRRWGVSPEDPTLPRTTGVASSAAVVTKPVDPALLKIRDGWRMAFFLAAAVGYLIWSRLGWQASALSSGLAASGVVALVSWAASFPGQLLLLPGCLLVACYAALAGYAYAGLGRGIGRGTNALFVFIAFIVGGNVATDKVYNGIDVASTLSGFVVEPVGFHLCTVLVALMTVLCLAFGWWVGAGLLGFLWSLLPFGGRGSGVSRFEWTFSRRSRRGSGHASGFTSSESDSSWSSSDSGSRSSDSDSSSPSSSSSSSDWSGSGGSFNGSGSSGSW